MSNRLLKLSNLLALLWVILQPSEVESSRASSSCLFLLSQKLQWKLQSPLCSYFNHSQEVSWNTVHFTYPTWAKGWMVTGSQNVRPIRAQRSPRPTHLLSQWGDWTPSRGVTCSIFYCLIMVEPGQHLINWPKWTSESTIAYKIKPTNGSSCPRIF